MKIIARKLLRLGNDGFSMLELMLYVAIVGVVVSFAIPKYNSATAMANTAKVQADLQTLNTAIVMYRAQNGADPASVSSLSDYVVNVSSVKPPSGTVMTSDGLKKIEAQKYSISKNAEGEAEASLGGYLAKDFSTVSAGEESKDAEGT